MKRFACMVLTLILLLVSPVSAFAATITVTANVEYATGLVTITGVTSAGADKAVTVIVLNPSGGTDYLNQTRSGPDGSYQFAYTLEANTGDVYTVRVGGTDIAQPVTTAFAFAPPTPEPDEPENPNPGVSNPGGQIDLPDTQTPASGADEWVNPYSDVQETDWFYNAARLVTENGLMQGTGGGQFSPNTVLTRGMLAAILYRMETEPQTGGGNPFPDITNQFYAKAAVWAYESGIMLGYGNFGGDDPLTREQLATVLHRFAKAKQADDGARADLGGYTDTSAVSDWAAEAMEWAAAKRIIQGRTATALAPQGHATRAEVAVVVARYIQNILNA